MDRLMAPRTLLIGVLTAAALFGVFGEFQEPISALLAFPYLVAVPGLAWMSDGGGGHVKPVDQFVVSVGLTLAMEITLGTFLLMCGQWSPRLLFGMLLVAMAVGLAFTSLRGRSAGRGSRT